MKTAVIYARYSSDSQTEQSIEGQLRVCQQYAKEHDILVVDTYIDRAMTGTNDLRPDFQRMIRNSSKLQWEYVIVYKLDRFSRNRYENAIHKNTLKNNGVKLISAMENIPETPEGVILESLLEGMNQYYSLELSQKVSRGLKESYLKGNYTGGRQLFGYDTKDKKNIINTVEADIVKDIFIRYSHGQTANEIVADLKKQGVRGKTGRFLETTNIYKILFNPKYNGRAIHGGTTYTNIYPAIIDDELWEQVQAIHRTNEHSPGKKKDIYNFILSGKLFCEHCGTRLVGESGTSKTGQVHYYYNCLGRRRKHLKCDFKAMHKDELEQMVVKNICEVLSNEQNIKFLAKGLCKHMEQERNNNDELKYYEKKKQTALKSCNNLIKALEQGIITEQTKQRLKELEEEINTIDFEIAKQRQTKHLDITEEKIVEYLHSCFDSNFMDNIDIQKAIIDILIREIIIGNGRILIVYNFTKESPQNDPPDNIKELQKLAQSKENSSYSSYKTEKFPPSDNNPNPCVWIVFYCQILFHFQCLAAL